VLLESAGEVEHMLMVQYLYAAMTLKSAGAPGLTAAQKQAVAAWRVILTDVAIEEMGHLMAVQNLTLLVRGLPNFDREEFPPRSDLYPFELHLEPLSFASLAKYVLAEAPLRDDDLLDDYRAAAGATEVRHVGVIYGLLDLLFRRPDEVPEAGAADEWDAFVAQLAEATGARLDPGAWHLPLDACDPDSGDRQAAPDDFPSSAEHFFFSVVRAPQEARLLLREIGLQGEAPVEQGGRRSHYQQFRTIAEGGTGLLAFPRDGSWEPALDVGIDPKLPDFAGPAVDLAVACDRSYHQILFELTRYLDAPVDSRGAHADAALGHMSALKLTARALLQVPQRPDSSKRASPLFSPPDP